MSFIMGSLNSNRFALSHGSAIARVSLDRKCVVLAQGSIKRLTVQYGVPGVHANQDGGYEIVVHSKGSFYDQHTGL